MDNPKKPHSLLMDELSTLALNNISNKDNVSIFIECISICLMRYKLDKKTNEELPYSKLKKELLKIENLLKKLGDSISLLPEQSTLRTFQNSQAYLRKRLSSPPPPTDDAENFVQKIPSHVKYKYDALRPFLIQLESEPHLFFKLLIDTLLDATKNSKNLAPIKNKQMDKIARTELVINVAFIISKFYSKEKINFTENGFFNEVMTLIFIHLGYPVEIDSTRDVIRGISGNKIENITKHFSTMNLCRSELVKLKLK